MGIVLLVLAGVVLAAHLYRQFWTHRDLPQMFDADFDGELFRVGETCIARRAATSGSNRTIVCFPGFLEDMRYFQALYADTEAELILVNNADYHCSFPRLKAETLDWPANPHPLGSIEYDGFYLGLVLRELATGSEITVHGHSRGGAVALEAGRQYPELTGTGGKKVRAILEAPVLPGGRAVGKGNEPLPHALICYFMPIVLGLSRGAGPEQLLKQPMMKPTNDLKTRICLSIYSNARHYRTCVANVQSIVRWQRETPHSVYANYPEIQVVMGARDDVLDNPGMLASAEAGAALNPGLSIVATGNTNHFVTLEAPHYLRALYGGS